MFRKGGACVLALLCAITCAGLLLAEEYPTTVLRPSSDDAIQSAGRWFGQPQLRLTSYGEAVAGDCGCGQADGCCPQGGCGCALGDCCACDPGLVAFVEWTNWKVRSKALTFGCLERQIQIEQQTITALDSLSISLPRRDGVRVGLGYRFPSCWDIIWIYTYYYTNDETSIQRPMRSELVMPVSLAWYGIQYPFSVEQLEARTSFKYDVNDLEIGRRFILGDCANVRLFGGFRWAILHQEANFGIVTEGGDYPTVLDLATRTRVDAYGLRMGAEGRWQLGGSGISVFGRGAGSVLAGIFDTEASMISSGGSYIYRQQATRALPVLEAAAGVAWSCNNLDVSAGYEMATWFNLAAMGFNPSPDNNVLLDGFFVRLAYRY